MSELKTELKNKRKSRAGHKSYLTQVFNDVDGCLEDYTEERKNDIVQWKEILQEQQEKLTNLNKRILELMEADDDITEDDMSTELLETNKVKFDVKVRLSAIEEKLADTHHTPALPPSPSSLEIQGNPLAQQNHQTEQSHQTAPVRAKLPKLEVRKFGGNISEWQEFWDSFESAIDKNATLAEVDKFSYLRGLLVEPARSAIAGFALTSANYKAATDLLKKRYGKKTAIQRAYINDLLNMEPIYSERDTNRLRMMYDFAETKHRALEALGVGQDSYSAIVVPSLLEKLPEQLRLTITRGEDHHEWNLQQLLETLGHEIELREEYNKNSRPARGPRDEPRKRTTMHAGKQMNCAFCLEGHKHEDCQKVKNVKERKQILLKYGRCFNCIRRGHVSRQCKTTITCKFCKGKHHSCLCCTDPTGEGKPTESEGSPSNLDSAVGNSMHIETGNSVALQTAQAQVAGQCRSRIRVLFDTASHTSFVTSRVAKTCGLEIVRREWLAVNTFGQRATGSNLREVVGIPLTPVGGGSAIYIEAFVVPEISRVPNERLDIVRTNYPHLADIWLSDVCRNKDQLEIDVLIGADYLWSFQTGNVVRGGVGEPVAIETHLGWVISGPLGYTQSTDRERAVSVNFVGTDSSKPGNLAERDVQFLWDLETLGIKESDGVYEEFVDNIAFNGSRYSVKLPWKEGRDSLDSNYELSLARMKGQVRKLRKEPEVLQEYDSVIKDQLVSGVIERVAELEESDRVHYIPHLAVIRKEATTTKLRVVYDASAKASKGGVSLNDCLHKGPSLTPLLFDILIRFREKRIALIGDIEKAFLNVEVDKADRDFLRFLWLENASDPESKIAVYRFCRVVFGLNASPFLLNATLRHHISTFKDEDPEFVRKMIESFYVDDLVTGEDDTNKALSLYDKSKNRMARGGFKLRKWMTNDKVLKGLIDAQENQETASESVTTEEETYAKFSLGSEISKSQPKVLGLPWDCENDEICFSFEKIVAKAQEISPTKRGLLSLLASMFDPVGLISPVIVCMKMLFQELCRENLGWDDKLGGKAEKKWSEWVLDLFKIKRISVSRCIYDSPKQEVLECCLHGFGDASNRAYCAVVYFVYRTRDGMHARLLASRSRVAPLKALTIPRLELMSARILAQLMSTVKKALEAQVTLGSTRYWLDSKTAIWWIQNRGEWKQFVRHRVNEILKLTSKEEWRHCPGEDNPADIGSRGVMGSKLKDSELWWKGPSWLCEEENKWPANQIITCTQESQEEAKKEANVMIVGAEDLPTIAKVVNIDRQGRLRKLLRVTAWVLRFVKNSKLGGTKRKGELSRDELIAAEKEWIKAAQSDLKSQKSYANLRSVLGLKETDGILRCGGRLANSDLAVEAQEPIILPRDHVFTIKTIEECHERVLHGGARETLAELRSKFWIPKGRQCVKKVVSRCVVCKKLEGKAYGAPRSAALPEFRVKEAPPFSKVGVDFAGPLFVKTPTGSMKKAYIALFSCCVTRALHLELVEDLSAETFTRALRRFAARRGTPVLIVSDNAKTFKATNKALKKLYDHPEVTRELSGKKIEWKFNLERAPWWGGFFERMVGCVKRCLRKVLGSARLTFDELFTVLIEVEGTLNSRPLTYDYQEEGEEVLTPSHLMFGRRIKTMPDEIIEEEEECESRYTRRFRYLSVRLAHFWNRWRREYLTDLREYHRNKVSDDAKLVQIGDVVTVYEENKKRGEWKMAVVESLIKGKDEVVRGANIRVIAKGKPTRMSRPVQRLFPIEVRSDAQKETQNERVQGNPIAQRRNPRRAAAVDARWKTNLMLDS